MKRTRVRDFASGRRAPSRYREEDVHRRTDVGIVEELRMLSGTETDLLTDPEAPGSKGLSLLVVERHMPGFSRGRNLEKVGLKAQDTAELFFDEVRIPDSYRVGGTCCRGCVHC